MTARQDFLGPGWAYPVATTPDGGSIQLVAGETDIAQAIRILVGTPLRSRPFRPDFGCGIHDLVFAGMDAATVGEIQQHVKHTITRYEPRVELEGVDVTPSEEDPVGVLEIEIRYRVRATNTPANLTYPFYLRERRT